jgi:hypothetical protein
MCQKNLLKSFFVLLNHPAPLQKPLVLRVLKSTPQTMDLFEKNRNFTFLSAADVKTLGVEPPSQLKAYLLPIQIPREWFLH